MIANDRFGFAEETLEGIALWIREHNHYTDDQKIAVENILSAVEGEQK